MSAPSCEIIKFSEVMNDLWKATIRIPQCITGSEPAIPPVLLTTSERTKELLDNALVILRNEHAKPEETQKALESIMMSLDIRFISKKDPIVTETVDCIINVIASAKSLILPTLILALRALYCVSTCGPETQELVGEHTKFNSIIRLFDKNEEHEIKAAVFLILTDLTYGGEWVRFRLWTYTNLHIIIYMMERYKNMEIQELGCMALAHFTLAQIEHAKISGFIHSVLSAMREYPVDPMIYEYGAVVLDRVVSGYDSASTVYESNGIRILLKAFQEKYLDKFWHGRIRILSVLGKLALTSRLFCADIVNNDGLNISFNLLKRNMDESPRLVSAVFTFWNCFINEEWNYRVSILSMGGAKLCIQAMRKYPMDTELQTNGLNLLEALLN